MPEQRATILVCHVGKFLERLKLEENIEMQAGILRYLVTQGGKHVLLVRHSSPKHIFGIHLINLLKPPICMIETYPVAGKIYLRQQVEDQKEHAI
ncbi:hypothetical protein HMPREF0299_6981 [Corynebacterium matruchotii ATCC 14266]|uniref:Uncharacterized protein n=1 Tax=Corynebacterium matruchotii ATCC 14266 TaxID=553207 RepID=E0DGI3_9CORY|nr:hypothetical protein HMPREF0299_6981 [Corynebacterium matruchotii ATCC 14266]